MAFIPFDPGKTRSAFRTLRLPAAALALGLAAAPAAAQNPCPASGWSAVDTGGYAFAFVSRSRPGGGSAVNCVTNRHASRGMFVDWRGAGLRSAIPPGRTIFRTGPVASGAAPKRSLFFYGARPHHMVVPTIGALAPSAAPRPGAPPLLPGFLWQPRPAFADPPLAADPDIRTSLFVPIDPEWFKAMRKRRPSLAEMVGHFEARPDRLQAFEMTFENRLEPGPGGRVAVGWKCRYRLPGLARAQALGLTMRFADSALHRRMFGDPAPAPVGNWKDEMLIEASLPPLPSSGVGERRTRFEILLPDGRTPVASIPIRFYAPARS